MESRQGYVYVLTNPSFREDWVKIGKSSRSPNVRSKELDNSSVPLPYEIYATLKSEKFNEAEQKIHKFVKKLNPNLRIRANREFFNIKPEDAAEILEDIAELIDDAEVEYWKDGKVVAPTGSGSDNGDERKCKKIANRFSFYEKGLEDGDRIYFVADKNISAVVSGEREVIFENKTWKLSPLAYELFKRRNELNTSGAYHGTAYFMFNNKKVKDL